MNLIAASAKTMEHTLNILRFPPPNKIAHGRTSLGYPGISSAGGVASLRAPRGEREPNITGLCLDASREDA